MAKKVEYENVILTLDGAAATILLNRPKKKNACSPALNLDMIRTFAEIEKSDGIKVIVITGAGDAFCGGMDLEKFFLEPMLEGPDRFKEVNNDVTRWMRSIQETEAVTVCSINGHCFGHGINMVALCDLALAAEDAKFGLSEVNFGVLPAGGTMWGVANNFTRKQGLYYALTGETFTGKEAVELGLVTRAVPREKLAEETDRVVKNLVGKNPITLAAIKKTYERMTPMSWLDAVDYENAKALELTFYQGAKGWIQGGLTQFKERKYKPGLESYKLEEEE